MTTSALDQAYFNFTVGAAFVAGAIVIISLTITNLSNNRKKQQKLLDILEKRINLRRRMLDDIQSNTWRSTNNEIIFSEDFARLHGIDTRITHKEFAKYIHKDSLESWKLLQEYHETLGRKNIRLLILSPSKKEWHWYKVSFNSTKDNQLFAYSGIFSCIDDEIKRDETKRKLQIQLDQYNQEFEFMHATIPAMKRLLTQYFESVDIILKSNPGDKEQELKEANATLHSSADSFRKLTQSLSSRRNNSYSFDSGQ